MKAFEMDFARTIHRRKVNERHAASILNGKPAQGHKWLRFEDVVSAIAAHGYVVVARVIREALDEKHFHEQLRKAA